MSQKKVLLYSPEGKEEWFMEDDAPAGWTPTPPVTEEQVAASEAEEADLKKQVDELEADPEVPEHSEGLTDVQEPAEEAAEDGGDMRDPEAAE
jgi:hypothetical protein